MNPSQMKNRPSRLKAERYANDLLDKYCIENSADIPLEDIIFAEGACYQVRKMKGCLGSLIRKGSQGMISVSQDIWHKGQKRFVTAHELGHWQLHKDMPNFHCTDEDFLKWHSAKSKFEIEANAFAAEFLMPEKLFRRLCENRPLSANLIRDLAVRLSTSTTATALRLTELEVIEPMMMVFSKNRQISWTWPSPNFRFNFYGHHFPVPSTSLTHDFYQKGIKSNEPTSIKAVDWFVKDRKVKRDDYLYEFTIPQPSINGCLTFLWEDELNFSENEDFYF